MKTFGRRARDVMPAAMRALVRTSTWYSRLLIGQGKKGSGPDHYMEVLRNATTLLGKPFVLSVARAASEVEVPAMDPSTSAFGLRSGRTD
jgi:hypothetical protein